MDGKDGRVAESAFDLPALFPLLERRRAELAEGDWRRAGRAMVAGCNDHSVIVDDPGGAARLRRVGQAVTNTFELFAEMVLARYYPIVADLSAACDLIALQPEPLHFEASKVATRLACILLRGVALPIENNMAVQIVLSWREVLDRAAIARLQRDLTMALRFSLRISPRFNQFARDFPAKSEKPVA